MSNRAALPGLATGILGLLAGIVGLIISEPLFGLVGGLLALAAGVAGLRIAQRFSEQIKIQNIIEQELQSVKQESEATEARIDELRESQQPETATNQHNDKDVLLDADTGLFSQNFFEVALDSRIASARRHLRPISVILVEVVSGVPDETSEVDAALVANAIKTTIREADTACRLQNGYFALMLEDTPENGAVWTVERLRRSLNETQSGATVWAGVACYPAHAFTREEILKAAEDALTSARDWRQDRIEIALAAPDS